MLTRFNDLFNPKLPTPIINVSIAKNTVITPKSEGERILEYTGNNKTLRTAGKTPSIK
jgi:hypothetical protein